VASRETREREETVEACLAIVERRAADHRRTADHLRSVGDSDGARIEELLAREAEKCAGAIRARGEEGCNG